MPENVKSDVRYTLEVLSEASERREVGVEASAVTTIGSEATAERQE